MTRTGIETAVGICGVILAISFIIMVPSLVISYVGGIWHWEFYREAKTVAVLSTASFFTSYAVGCFLKA